MKLTVRYGELIVDHNLVEILNTAQEQEQQEFKKQVEALDLSRLSLTKIILELQPDKIQFLLDTIQNLPRSPYLSLVELPFDAMLQLLTKCSTRKLDLTPYKLHFLSFEKIKEVAELCKRHQHQAVTLFCLNSYSSSPTASFANFTYEQHQAVTLFCLNSYSSSPTASFANFTYEQQQELALLYLQCLCSEKSQINYSTYAELLPLDVLKYPAAFYELIEKFILFRRNSTESSHIIEQCYNKKLLNDEQACKLHIHNAIHSSEGRDFDHTDLSIENVCEFITEFCDFHSYTKICKCLGNLYQNIDITQKAKFYSASLNNGFLDSSLIKDLDEAEKIMDLLQTPLIVEDYITMHKNALSNEQKISALEKALIYNKSINFHNLGLDFDTALGYYNRIKNPTGLIELLLTAGWDKAKILQYLEEFLTKLDVQYTYLSLYSLKLNQDEIIEFVQRNPGWGHVLDNWISGSTKAATQETLDTLLDIRIKFSNYFFSANTVKIYNISKDKIPSIIEQITGRINIEEEVVKELEWDALYACYKVQLQKNSSSIMAFAEADRDKYPENIKTLLSVIDLSQESITVEASHPKDLFSFVNKQLLIASNAFDSILELSDAGMSKAIYKMTNRTPTTGNMMSHFLSYLWLVALYVRLLAEVDKDLLRKAFQQTEFLTTIEEISILAAPHLRTKLINCLIDVANSAKRLDNLCKLLHKSNKRCHIPALIIASKVSEIEKFSPLLKQIGGEYNDNRYMRPLINSLYSLFSSPKISEADKLNITMKIFSYELQINLIDSSGSVPTANLAFNSMRLTQIKNALSNTSIFSLQAYGLDGEFIDIPNIAKEPRLAHIDKLLQKMLSNHKRIARQAPVILGELKKTKMFPFGVYAEQQALLMLQGLDTVDQLGQVVTDPDFSRKSWVSFYGKALQVCFNLSDTELAGLIQQLRTCRNQTALIAYYAGLKTLPNGKVFIDMLQTYAKLIASPNARDFYRYRYALEQQPQLNATLSNNKRLLRFWQEGLSIDYGRFISHIPKQDHTKQKNDLDINGYLIKIIKHFEHLSPFKFPHIHEFLNTNDEKNKAKIRALVENLFNQTNGDGYEAKIKKYRLELQLKLIEFFMDYNNADLYSKNRHLSKIEHLSDECGDAGQFSEDMDNLTTKLTYLQDPTSNKLNSAATNTESWKISDTGHFWDMLLMGTEVTGSCQDVNGNAEYNCCLVGATLSGHIKIIAIINEDAEIVARAILRLMLDRKTNAPILFLEEIYPPMCNAEHEYAINQFAILRAWQLGCTLVSKGRDLNQNLYPNPLAVVEVKAAEYVDAIGTQQNSGYIIPESKLLFNYPVIQAKIIEQAKKHLYDTGMQMGHVVKNPSTMVNDLPYMFSMYKQLIKNKKAKLSDLVQRSNLLLEY